MEPQQPPSSSSRRQGLSRGRSASAAAEPASAHSRRCPHQVSLDLGALFLQGWYPGMLPSGAPEGPPNGPVVGLE